MYKSHLLSRFSNVIVGRFRTGCRTTPPSPIKTPATKPKKQYEPHKPKTPITVKKVVEKVIYSPPPLEDLNFIL